MLSASRAGVRIDARLPRTIERRRDTKESQASSRISAL
jgi:hypothetical protein